MDYSFTGVARLSEDLEIAEVDLQKAVLEPVRHRLSNGGAGGS